MGSLRGRPRRSLHWSGHSWLLALLLASCGVLAMLLFLHLGSEATEGETQRFDYYMLRSGQALRTSHPWITEVMRDLSGLGSTVALSLFTVAACGYIALTVSWANAG